MRRNDPIHPHGFGVAVDDVPQPIEAFAPVWLDIAFSDEFLESEIAYVQNPRTIVSVDEHRADRLVELRHVQSTTVQ
ncbi:hypothetical protein ACFW0F_06815 [Brucella anthropi]|uniref:hypothetical protein n=1 Tax=Brucella anthropi TaxID=529 RepID=UPI00366CB7CB